MPKEKKEQPERPTRTATPRGLLCWGFETQTLELASFMRAGQLCDFIELGLFVLN